MSVTGQSGKPTPAHVFRNAFAGDMLAFGKPKLTGAIKTTERKLAHGSLRTEIDVLAGGKCRVEPKGNAIIITKQASGSAKIDPLMATFNVISLM
jgi:phage terminase large subunit-like protein